MSREKEGGGGMGAIGIIGVILLLFAMFRNKSDADTGGDDIGTLPPWVPTLAQIEAMTTKATLDAAQAQVEQAYQAEQITRKQYDLLYAAYLRRGYWIDLNDRGGTWVQAATEFWGLTSGITDADQLRNVYDQVYNKYAGGTTQKGTIVISFEPKDIQFGTFIDGHYEGSVRYPPYGDGTITREIDPGSHQVTFDDAGGYTKPAPITVSVNAGETKQVVGKYIRIQPTTAFVSGTVRSTSNEEIGGAVVKIGTYTDTTDAAGNYEITGIAPGTYAVSVSKAGYVDYTRTLTLSAGDGLPMMVYLVPDTEPPPYSGNVPTRLASIWSHVGSNEGSTAHKVVWAYRNGIWLVYDSASPGTSDLASIISGDRVSVWVDAGCTLSIPNGQTMALQQGWNTFWWP